MYLVVGHVKCVVTTRLSMSTGPVVSPVHRSNGLMKVNAHAHRSSRHFSTFHTRSLYVCSSCPLWESSPVWWSSCPVVVIPFSLVVIATFIVKRRNKLVMATSLPLSMIILSGTLLVAIGVVAFVVPPTSNGVCVVRGIAFHCAISLIYVPLFVKNMRIYRIFRAGANKVLFTSNKMQMLFTAILAAIQVGRISYPGRAYNAPSIFYSSHWKCDDKISELYITKQCNLAKQVNIFKLRRTW